jgi:hypothetical protein
MKAHDCHYSIRDWRFHKENEMTKLLKSAFIATVISSMAITPAWADRYGYHGGGHGGGGWDALGFALFGTALYLAATAPPPAYYPAPVYAPYAPPSYAQQVYVQQPVVVAQTYPPALPVSETQQNWWYYCAQSAGYYPYVRACPTGWTRVSPIPPGQ